MISVGVELLIRQYLDLFSDLLELRTSTELLVTFGSIKMWMFHELRFITSAVNNINIPD
jgi:hypothetical protein